MKTVGYLALMFLLVCGSVFAWAAFIKGVCRFMGCQ